MLLTITAFGVKAQDNTDVSNLVVAPKYFGPYAFPVPDMLDGTICNDLHLELSGDMVVGNIGGNSHKDYTYAPTYCIHLPLWTSRATLSVWGEFQEFYNDTEQARAARGVDPKEKLKDTDTGNLYFSLDMLILREKKYIPSLTLRSTIQTATGDHFERARHFDAPGYYFELSTGKDFKIGDKIAIRPALALDFVCWQSDNGRQNDALGWGAQVAFKSPVVTFSTAFGQYNGIQGNGDLPRTINSRLEFHIGKWSPFIYYRHGYHDWPFDQYRVGLYYRMDILKYMKKHRD